MSIIAMLPAELHQFFERYAAAFNALDGSAVAELYAEPTAIAQSGEVSWWPSRSAVIENMNALCAQYRARGYQHAQWEVATYLNQGELHAVVDLRWSIQWTSPAPPWVFNTTYNLARQSSGWRIILCTAHQEDALHRHSNVA